MRWRGRRARLAAAQRERDLYYRLWRMLQNGNPF